MDEIALLCSACSKSFSYAPTADDKSTPCPACNEAVTMPSPRLRTVKWYYLFEDEEVGPVKFAQMQRIASKGLIGEDTPIRAEGMKDTLPAKKLPQLFAGVKVKPTPRKAKTEPIVEIEPCFPGCLISPERLRIDVSPVTQTVRFWVTPLTEGDLDEACVRIFYRGRLVEELPTPTKVVKRTWGYVCIAAGLGWPIFQWVAQRLGWSPMDEINEGFPVVGRLFESIGVTAGSLLIGGVLLAIGGLIYRLTRPIEANQSEVPLLA